MRALRVGYRSARVWLGELPPAKYHSTEFVHAVFPAGGEEPRTTQAAVELLLPHGARISYGLLGCEFEAVRSTDLTIRVGVFEGVDPKPAWSLGSKLDTVKTGLRKEYALATVRGASVAGLRFPPGVLSFVYAIHGEVGSSPALFERMENYLVELLLVGEPDIQDAELKRILEL